MHANGRIAGNLDLHYSFSRPTTRNSCESIFKQPRKEMYISEDDPRRLAYDGIRGVGCEDD
jgi:hypothetical protein